MPDLSYDELIRREAQALAARRHPMRLLFIFLMAFFAMQYAWESCRGTAVERVVIDDLTARPAAWLIDRIWSGQGVTAQGHRLVSPHGRLNILNGCEGLEALFLLLAAFMAYPFTWRARLMGMGLGTVLVFTLNQGRILALWQSFLRDRELFALLHGTVLPLVLVAACIAFFVAFLARHEPRPA
jgi:exosortase/archaeosortase family protein